MATGRYCPNPDCPNYIDPRPGWFYRHGSYLTRAHGRVPRIRCKCCGTTAGDQTFDITYYAKHRADLQAIYSRQRGGSSCRDIAREMHLSRNAVANAILRLGRQAMATQTHLLSRWNNSRRCVYDGLQSYLTSQDTPCHITAAVDGESEVVLSMTHTVLRRGGTMRPAQKRRRAARERVWKPRAGALRDDISLLVREIPNLMSISGAPDQRCIIDTDRLPVYRRVMQSDVAMQRLRMHGVLRHRRTDSRKPRTADNPLFPVNYFDMLIRHRLKEHTRETIAFGRHAVHQMHRMWLMVHDHNTRQPYRVKREREGLTHGQKAGFDQGVLDRTAAAFFRERIDLRGVVMPESIEKVWRGQLESPPVRWKSGQTVARRVRVPAYALRDLDRMRIVSQAAGAE